MLFPSLSDIPNSGFRVHVEIKQALLSIVALRTVKCQRIEPSWFIVNGTQDPFHCAETTLGLPIHLRSSVDALPMGQLAHGGEG
jgi:hypothetical protein